MAKKIEKRGQQRNLVGVRLISILHYTAAAFLVLMSVLLIISIIAISKMPSGSPDPFGGIGIVFGILILAVSILVMLGIAVLDFFIARDLMRARPWARIAAIILSGLCAFSFLSNIMTGILVSAINGGNSSAAIVAAVVTTIIVLIGLAVNAYIFFYLLLNKNVKKVFSLIK